MAPKMTTLSLKMDIPTTRYCHWLCQATAQVQKMMNVSHKTPTFQNHMGCRKRKRLIRRGPLARPPARTLISRSWPTGCRGLLPGRPELSFNSKLRTPIAVLDGPFQKASFYNQFFTLLQICRRKEEVRSKTGRPAGQTNFRKSIKKCQHSR